MPHREVISARTRWSSTGNTRVAAKAPPLSFSFLIYPYFWGQTVSLNRRLTVATHCVTFISSNCVAFNGIRKKEFGKFHSVL